MTQTRQDCEDTQLPSIDYNWTAPISDEEFDYFRAIAHREAGISIADFKRNMVFRRVSKRVRILGLKSIPEYRRYLDGGHWDSERQPLINALTTNKTSFFREEHHFRYLEQTVLPELTAASRAGVPRRLRIWSAGCSSGEEPYSIAMTLHKMIDRLNEFAAESAPPRDARPREIFATPIPEDQAEAELEEVE